MITFKFAALGIPQNLYKNSASTSAVVSQRKEKLTKERPDSPPLLHLHPGHSTLPDFAFKQCLTS